MKNIIVTLDDETRPNYIATLPGVEFVHEEVRYFIGYDCCDVVNNGPSAVDVFVLLYPLYINDELTINNDDELAVWAEEQGFDQWCITDKRIL